MDQEQQEARQAPPAARRGVAALVDQAWFLMTAPALLWAGNVILGRAIAGHVPPVGLAFWRWTIASVFALPLAWPHLRRDIWPMLRAAPMTLLLSFLGVALFNTLLYKAAETTTAVNMVTLSTATPVLIVVASFLFFGQKVTARQGIGIALSLAGALTLIAHGDPAALIEFRANPGDLLLSVGVIGYALYTALLRRTPPVHPFSFLFVSFILAVPMLLPFYVLETLHGRPMTIDPVAVSAVLYTAIFPSILAYLAFNHGVAVLGANVEGLSLHLIPVFGVVLAAVLLHELPQSYHFVGIPLIAAGIYLATRRPKPAPAEPSPGRPAQ